MPVKKNSYCLHYSPLLDLRLISTIIYVIQLFLLKIKLQKHIYLGKNDRKIIKYIAKTTSNNHILCKDLRIGYPLRNFKDNLILSLKENQKIIINNNDTYNQVMWTLTFTGNFCVKTQKKVKHLIYKNYAKKNISNCCYKR